MRTLKTLVRKFVMSVLEAVHRGMMFCMLIPVSGIERMGFELGFSKLVLMAPAIMTAYLVPVIDETIFG